MHNSPLQVYYDEMEIIPSPKINISKDPIYVGDTQIGANYQIELNGFALSTIIGESNMPKSLADLDAIQFALHKNGKTFRVWDNCNQANFLVATGGKIVSFNVEEGNWYNYIKYSATLEFSDIVVNGYNIETSTGINIDTVPVLDTHMASLLFKLKSYNDNWSFTVSDSDAYMYYTRMAYEDSGGEPAISMEDYSQIQVSYTVNATGKTFYNLTNTATAAHETAKNFVQYKLYHQIAMFRNGGILSETPFMNTNFNSVEVGNAVNRSLTSNVNFQAIPVVPPILDRTIVDRYAIYDETIDCSTSETDGTFSATYTCVLKRLDTTIPAPRNSVHTYSMTYEQTRDFRSQNRTLSINGSLKGMLLTNILANINDGQNFILPPQGPFFGIGNDTVSKFGNAYEDFTSFIVNTEIDDLKDNFKYVLGINYENLFPANARQQMPCIQERGYNFLYQVLAEPKSFNANYNYTQGTVEYSASYDTDRACAAERGFQSMTVSEDDALPVYAEHTIVGRTRGALTQNLNTNKAKSITISFQGVTKKTCGKRNPFSVRPDDLADPDFDGLSLNPCDTEAYTELPETVLNIYYFTELAAYNEGRPLVVRSFATTYNPADGSYDVSKTYMVLPVNTPTNELCQGN